MNRTLWITLAAVGLLATAGLATVAAEPGKPGPGGPGSNDHAAKADDMKAKAQEMKEKIKEHCAAPVNETVKEKCDKIKDIAGPAMKARREAVALVKAIAAHERQVGRIEVKIDRLEKAIASGNLSAENVTKAQAKIAKLQEREDKVLEQIEHLQDRLAALKAKWAEVKDHLKDVREDDAEDGTEASEPATTSAAASSSPA